RARPRPRRARSLRRAARRRRAETTATTTGHQRTDHVPDMPGPAEEHDLPVRARHVPDVRRPHHRVSHLPQAGREAHPPLLAT
ncbi:hypothetical protein O3G_MSEX001164, partial [Manduca sexta]